MSNNSVIAGTLVAAIAAMTYLQNNYLGFPGPFAYPIVGNGLDFVHQTNKGKYQDYICSLQSYGRVVRINVFGANYICTTDAALIKRVLTSGTEFWRDPTFANISHSLLDLSLFTIPSGDVWKRHRKNLQPAFAPTHLRQAGNITQNQADKLVRYYNSESLKNDGSITVDIYHEFTALSLDIIGQVIFSYDFHACNDLHAHKVQVGQGYIEELVMFIHQRFTLPSILWGMAGLSSNSTRVKLASTYMKKLIQNVIDKKKSELKQNDEKDPKCMDVLDRLLKVGPSESENFTDEEVVGEVVGFFIAGHETTANTLVNTTLELCRNPEITRKILAEIHQVESTLGHPINTESLSSLKYLEMVIKESLRMYAVVASTYRTTLCRIEHEGNVIPSNTKFIVNIGGVHHEPVYWDKPEKFDPDRWADGFVPIPGSYLPFGDGPMACIGQKMAMIEIKLALCALLSSFDMELVPNQDIVFVTSITTGLKHGLKVKLTPRSAASV
ncbi:hypothetical protein BDV3_003618 [Batrachochytrium dendrobatidis]|uniref:Cytochrome P450 n=1 Tax=Batrachochytrium dendrobatidis (strain JEL423) TaxID=403673 RepID=A0A177WEC2_BATDL|nr:hypothetical protein BDEG_21993 [Batrachochytrium dendrobatidis JEL423]